MRVAGNGTPTPGEDEFLGIVEASEFLGDRLELVVRAADVSLTVCARADLGCSPGQDIVVAFDPATTSYLAS